MTNIRKLAEGHLKKTLEGEYGLPVILINPEGEVIDTNNNDDALTGQIFYDTLVTDLMTGGEAIDSNPVVTLRLSSLPQVPEAGQDWAIKIPIVPDPDAETQTFTLSKSQPPEPRRSLGLIKLYLEKTSQQV